MRIFLKLLSTVALTLALSGCGVLIGNVKPVDEKSEAYGVMDLSKENLDWKRLDPSEGANDSDKEDAEKTEVSDVAFQNKKNASIISLNSACRASFATSDQDLRSFTNLLFLGISDITLREEKNFRIQDIPALQTTIKGNLNQEGMMLRTVIVKRQNCVYDLMYVSRPKFFADNEADFSRFVSSLRLK